MKIFISHVNAHQRAFTMKEALNSQLYKIILPIDNSQSLSSASLVLAPVHNGLMIGVTMVARRKARHGPNSVGPSRQG